jgi:hypothetical protein
MAPQTDTALCSGALGCRIALRKCVVRASCAQVQKAVRFHEAMLSRFARDGHAALPH